MTMQHRRNHFDGRVSFKGELMLDRHDFDQAIKIRNIGMASRRITSDYPALASWYCLRVMTGCEATVEKSLSDEDIEAFMPMKEPVEMKRRGRLITLPARAVLPGYVFVRCVYSAAAMCGLRMVPDVLDLVGGAIRPMRIGDKSMLGFKALVDGGGFTEAKPEIDIFPPGTKVVVNSGPFENLKGIVGKRNGKGRKTDDDSKGVPVDLSHSSGVDRIILPLAMLSIL